MSNNLEGNMAPEITYSDKLVEITQDSILLRNYYFPFGSKRVAFAKVRGIEVKEDVSTSEKWRIQGTMNFLTWYPRDWRRPTRDRVFYISFPERKWRIAFTVEDSSKVESVLSDQGLL
jgi:hypothetical protein